MKNNMIYGLAIIALFIWIMIELLKKKNKTVQGFPMPDIKKYKYQDFIESAALKYNIPAARIFGHMMQESSGNPTLTGKAAERGLMQIKEIAFKDVKGNFIYFNDFDFSDLWSPEINIHAGAAYLSLCRRWVGGNLNEASQAYNIGIGNFLKKKDLSKGLAYLEKVINYEGMV